MRLIPLPASTFLRWLAALPLLGLLSNGTCQASYCSGECDSRKEDAGAAAATSAAPHDAYLLRGYRVVPSGEPGAHPVAALLDIQGPAARGASDAAAWFRFTEQLRLHNPQLLGIPAAAGELLPEVVERNADGTTVRWRQLPPPLPWLALAAGGQEFHFDARGRLRAVENHLRQTWLRSMSSLGCGSR